jgi:hypothetical protein
MAQLDGKQIKAGSIAGDRLAAGVLGGKPSNLNKNMAASVTTADGQSACATAIAATPAGGSYVRVSVNGLNQTLGDGDKLHDCYFSGDSGTTARAMTAIVATDLLYGVGSVAGFQLAVTDKIDFSYNV